MTLVIALLEADGCTVPPFPNSRTATVVLAYVVAAVLARNNSERHWDDNRSMMDG